jgi:hypothetical protein
MDNMINTIINIPTTFTCQYFQDNKTLIIRSTSKYIKEYLETINVEYSNILDGYIIETSKTIIDLIGMHKFINEKLHKNLEETLKAKESEKEEEENNDSYSTVETLEEVSDEPEGYIICIKNDSENDIYQWVIYFDENVDEDKVLKKKLFASKKKDIYYDDYYGGHIFKCKKNDKFIKNLEENNYIKVNGIFKKIDKKKLCLYLSLHLSSEERDTEVEKIKKAKGKFNFVNNGFLFPLNKEQELINLGYILID